MERPDRVTIPRCIGCGGMRDYESCETTCSERKLEIVSAGEYDELTAAATARRVRIDAFVEVLGKLVGGDPEPQEWQIAYDALRESARSALRRFGAEARDAAAEVPAPAESSVVWRCPECGGLDAPQECIGVCIWRPSEWVNVSLYEAERLRAELDRELERSLLGLVSRLAFLRPRHGEWERNWRALQLEAQVTSASAAGC